MSDKSTAELERVFLIPKSMGKHYVVFMRRGPNWTPLETPEEQALQNRHPAFLKSLHDSGKTLLHGPVIEGPDDSIRGFIILQAESAEAARATLEADPRVKLGHFVLEIFTWMADTTAWRER